jgi:hypothetical protein
MSSKRRPATEEELRAGRALAEALDRMHWTHADLADRLQVSLGLISQWVTAVVRLPSDICVGYRKLRGQPDRHQVRESAARYSIPTSGPVKRLLALISSGALSSAQIQLLVQNAEAFAAANRSPKREKAAAVSTAANLKKA